MTWVSERSALPGNTMAHSLTLAIVDNSSHGTASQS